MTSDVCNDYFQSGLMLDLPTTKFVCSKMCFGFASTAVLSAIGNSSESFDCSSADRTSDRTITRHEMRLFKQHFVE